MTDYKIPELPSDDELGITKKDLEELAEEVKPEPTDKELAALLGDAPKPPPPASKALDKAPPPPPGGPPPKKPEKKAPPAPREPAGPRSRWGGPAMLAALVAATWLTSSMRTVPAPAPANAPDTAFSSARAMSHLVEIARRPHPTGSPAHEQVRGYLLERLYDLGIEAEVQTTTSLRTLDTVIRAATIRNIVARIPGRASTGTIVLTAHYDGREAARAAGDAGVGVVSILETARALKAAAPLGNDVLLLVTDAEELGLMGARAFVAEHPAMADVKVVLSLEMRGAGGPSVMFETGASNGWIVRALAASGATPYTNSMSYEVYKRFPNDTDFTPFREAGKQGLNFAGIGRASVYHQAYDSPENLSEATLQHEGASALAVARYLGNVPLAAVDAPDAVFFTAPFLGLVVYDMGLVVPIAAALGILALLALLPVRRSSAGWVGIVVGLVLGLVSVAAAAAAGWGLMRWLPRFHPEFGSLHGAAFHSEGWYVSALVAVGLAVVTSLFGLARRRFAVAELAWGALLIPLATMAYATFAFPSAAMNLQVPLAAALLAVAIASVEARGRAGMVVTTAVLVLALPVLALLVPALETLAVGLSFRGAAVIGGVAAVVLLLLLPALDRLRSPNAWWAPTFALVAGAACLGLGIRAAAPDAARPAPSTLSYAYDHGSGEALWLTAGGQDPVDAAAQTWATERAGAGFTDTRQLPGLGLGQRAYHVAPAPVQTVRPPEVWMLSDTTVDGTRRLRVAVRSALGAELVQMRFPDQGPQRVVAVNGHPVTAEARPTRVDHWGIPDPVIVLDLETAPDASLAMDVVEHLLRPDEVLGPERFRRPPELAPDITWLSDRAIFRTPATALVVVPGPPPFPLEGAPVGAASPPAPEAATADSLAAPPVAGDTLPGDTVPPDTTSIR